MAMVDADFLLLSTCEGNRPNGTVGILDLTAGPPAHTHQKKNFKNVSIFFCYLGNFKQYLVLEEKAGFGSDST